MADASRARKLSLASGMLGATRLFIGSSTHWHIEEGTQ
jgi:hypothetical protein